MGPLHHESARLAPHLDGDDAVKRFGLEFVVDDVARDHLQIYEALLSRHGINIFFLGVRVAECRDARLG